MPNGDVGRILLGTTPALKTIKNIGTKMPQLVAEIVKNEKYMKRYPAYKRSGVEWLANIPREWNVKRLKYISKINPSRPADISAGLPCVFIPMEAMKVDGTFDNSITKPFSELKTGFTYFAENDVIFAKITPCFENGKGALLKNLGSEIGFGSTEFHVLRAKTNCTTPEFLYCLTVSGLFRSVGESFMQGVAGQKRVTNDFVQDFVIGLPSIREQVSITTFLNRKISQIDGLIAKKERMIELFKEERAAVINQAVTKGLNPKAEMKDSGIAWLGKVPKHWEINRIKWATQYVQNGVWGEDPTGTDDVVCIRVADFDRHNFKVIAAPETTRSIPTDQLKSKAIHHGDLLIEKSGGGEKTPVGCVVYYDLPIIAVCSNFIARMPIAKDMDARYWSYVHAMLYSNRITLLSIKQTTGIQNLDADAYLCEIIGFPPLREQKEISCLLDRKTMQIDDQVTRAQKAIELLKEYRTALISEVVTGKIDVRESVV